MKSPLAIVLLSAGLVVPVAVDLVATRFGWTCPSVLVLLAWLVSPAGPFR